MAEVLGAVDRELDSPSIVGSVDSDPLSVLRRQIAEFRREPVGGRLVFLKRLVYWFVASSFDRQTKILESLVDQLDRLSTSPALPRASGERSAVSPVRPGGSLELDELSPQSLQRVLDADAELLGVERVLLYSLVFGLRPRRVLEIGTFKGGSADVICAALDDLDQGRIYCVDPEPRLSSEVRDRLAHRMELIAEASPLAVEKARKAAGGQFDFAFIDGDHSTEGLLRDIEIALEHLEPGSHLVFHDSHFVEVEDGLHQAVRRWPEVIDCGELSLHAKPHDAEPREIDGRPVRWGGLRLLRFAGRAG